MTLRQKRADRGFTLVELLVVIIVIGILAAIAIPAFLNQRQKGFDATLKADLKNTETAFETYMAGGGTFEDIRVLTGAVNELEITGKNAASPATPPPSWKDFPELGHTQVGDDSRVVLISYRDPLSIWQPHMEGDYCLTGVNGKSNYNYPGGNASRYDEMLYVDRQSGGLRTMDELVERRASGKMVSCKAFVEWYMSANGIPVPAVTP